MIAIQPQERKSTLIPTYDRIDRKITLATRDAAPTKNRPAMYGISLRRTYWRDGRCVKTEHQARFIDRETYHTIRRPLAAQRLLTYRGQMRWNSNHDPYRNQCKWTVEDVDRFGPGRVQWQEIPQTVRDKVSALFAEQNAPAVEAQAVW